MEVGYRELTTYETLIRLSGAETQSLLQILKYVRHRVECHPDSGAKACSAELNQKLISKLELAK